MQARPLEEQLSVAEMIARQQELERKDKSIKPLNSPVVAKAHTPVYTMHRFFARRPYNVFETLIKHYSKPGDIILDPFMGGGVTVVEALRARRKVIGIDLNPIAHFITENEVKPVNLDKVASAFADIKARIKPSIYDLYAVTCAQCGGNATTRWAFWSTIVRCPNKSCGASIVTERAKKFIPGQYRQYQCPACRERFEPVECERIGEEILRLKYECSDCGQLQERDATADDTARYQSLITKFNEIVRATGLQFPQDEIPDGDRVRDDALFRKGYTHFYQLFTQRNLLANALLKQAIRTAHFESDIEEAMLFVFSSSLTWSCKMRKDVGHGWEHHGYWLPETHYESNVWDVFKKQFDGGAHSFWKGKEYSNKEIGTFARLTKNYAEVRSGEATCILMCASSHALPLPDNSVDVVITDPPFGGNVQYAELANFWAVWLKDVLGLSGTIDNTLEAVQTRHTGFATEKSLDHYENILFQIFKECHRLLKPDGWLVLTFHNRGLAVWMALQRAANRAGFKLPPETEDPNRGMLYQPPIEHYTTTIHQRVPGAMLGDFILSFKRQDIPLAGIPIGELSTSEEDALVQKAEELIQFHGGADDSTLMTGLIPYLNEQNLFGKLATADFTPLFSRHFIWDKQYKKWFTSDMVEPTTAKLKPLDYIPAEQFTEQVIYSLLKERKYASLDEILSYVYAKLVNSYRPGIPAINKVLDKICTKIPLPGYPHRQGFALKSTEPRVSTIKQPKTVEQKALFGEPVLATSLSHDQIIALIYSYAKKRGYDVHIGESEQRKNPELKTVSRPMFSGEEFGLSPEVFRTIVEIDMLLLRGTATTHAFEIATTVETANKAINDRYRNLFAAYPNLLVKTYLVVKDKDFNKAHAQVFSKANVQDGISQKIRLVRLSELTEDRFEKLLVT
jgi:putative DNA methylase